MLLAAKSTCFTQEATLSLMTALPRLIRKFQTEPAVVGEGWQDSCSLLLAAVRSRQQHTYYTVCGLHLVTWPGFSVRLPQVAPLLACVHGLRLELFALRNEERSLGDLLALVADQVRSGRHPV
jgi:hypothetical protein